MLKKFFNNFIMAIKIMVLCIIPFFAVVIAGHSLILHLITNPVFILIALAIFLLATMTVWLTYIEWLADKDIFKYEF